MSAVTSSDRQRRQPKLDVSSVPQEPLSSVVDETSQGPSLCPEAAQPLNTTQITVSDPVSQRFDSQTDVVTKIQHSHNMATFQDLLAIIRELYTRNYHLLESINAKIGDKLAGLHEQGVDTTLTGLTSLLCQDTGQPRESLTIQEHYALLLTYQQQLNEVIAESQNHYESLFKQYEHFLHEYDALSQAYTLFYQKHGACHSLTTQSSHTTSTIFDHLDENQLKMLVASKPQLFHTMQQLLREMTDANLKSNSDNNIHTNCFDPPTTHIIIADRASSHEGRSFHHKPKPLDFDNPCGSDDDDDDDSNDVHSLVPVPSPYSLDTHSIENKQTGSVNGPNPAFAVSDR
eukprot:UN00837